MTDIAALIERLDHAIIMATNDDISEPGSIKRQRHIEILEAMRSATQEIERSNSQNEIVCAQLMNALERIEELKAVRDAQADELKEVDQLDCSQRIRELEAERDRLQKWNELRAQDIITLGQKVGELEADQEQRIDRARLYMNRIHELEAERDKLAAEVELWKDRANRGRSLVAEMEQAITKADQRIHELEAEQLKMGALRHQLEICENERATYRAERDSIRAKTIEEIILMMVKAKTWDAFENELRAIAEPENEEK